MIGIYLILVPKYNDEVLEIIQSVELGKAFYKNKSFLVVGLGNSKKDAFTIVHNLIEDIFNDKKDLDELKQYICDKFF